MQDVLRLLAVDSRVAQIDEYEVHVGATGEHVDTNRGGIRLHQTRGEDLCAADGALLTIRELGLGRQLERGRLCCDHVHQRPTLLAGEHIGVDLLL